MLTPLVHPVPEPSAYTPAEQGALIQEFLGRTFYDTRHLWTDDWQRTGGLSAITHTTLMMYLSCLCDKFDFRGWVRKNHPDYIAADIYGVFQPLPGLEQLLAELYVSKQVQLPEEVTHSEVMTFYLAQPIDMALHTPSGYEQCINAFYEHVKFREKLQALARVVREPGAQHFPSSEL